MATASQLPLDGLTKRIHGKRYTYDKGCRCICCVEARRQDAQRYLASLSEEQRAAQRTRKRERDAVRRANPTEEQREITRAQHRNSERLRKARLTEEEREAERALQRERDRRYRAKPEYAAKKREEKRRRREADPEAWKAQIRRNKARRKERLAREGLSHTYADEVMQFWRQRGRCFYNGRHSLANGYHVDHVVPINGDDPNGHDGKDNIVLACPRCNLSKGGTHPMHFAGMMF